MEKFVNHFLKTINEKKRNLLMEDYETQQNSDFFKNTFKEEIIHFPDLDEKRMWCEFFEHGPLNSLIANPDVTEILVNSPNSIWYEINGRLMPLNDRFYHEVTFKNFIDRLSIESKLNINIENPAAYGEWKKFRVTLVHSSITKDFPGVSLRRLAPSSWSIEDMMKNNWSSREDLEILKKIIQTNKNILVVGSTGAGKTSLINALIKEIPKNERIITIEDTPELTPQSDSALQLLTQNQSLEKCITSNDLLKYSLRLRPDRIIMGEIRGEEAKDFILTLSTGHAGSMSTLHADNPHQALFRLEMLVQMGAPQWSLQTIRRMIWLSLNYIVCCHKDTLGQRRLKGIYKITSLEETGFLLEQVDHSLHF